MSRRARSVLALGPTLAALICGGAWQARPATAQAPVQATPTTTTPNLLQQLVNVLFPTTTTVPAPPQTAAQEPAPSTNTDSGGPSPAPSDPDQSTTERTIPPEAQRIINSVLRTGSNNSLGLLEALRRLADVGLSQEEAALIGMGQFPVAGEAYWSDDWYEARFTPEFHFHQGTDVFAARGTPVRSPVDGRFEDGSGGAGGLAANIYGNDGTMYYMAHLDGFPEGLYSGQRVKQGDVVGFVGSSGNAEGGSPHLHLQVHPGGGAPINPKPILDRWINEAIANVPKVLANYRTAGSPRPFIAAGLTRRLDAGSLGAPVTSDGPQLWATNLRRRAGNVPVLNGLPEGEIPAWDPRVRGAAARAADWQRAKQLAQDVLSPLTPRVLDGVLTAAGG